MQEHITPYNYKISIKDRSQANQHRSFLIWFTGLSGSGKSTLANALEKALFERGIKTYILDGDNIRNGINKDLSFSPEDRTENIRRIGEVAHLMIDAGLVVLAAFVSPYRKDRIQIKNRVKHTNFIEVFVNTSVEECERRDVKGLYKKARKGTIKNMTGISAPYEVPEAPDVEVQTEHLSVDESIQKIITYITPKLTLNYE